MRQYISTAHFNAPFEGAYYLSGLGNAAWPTGRAYYSTAHFRSPYDQGYFQDNNLMGLGAFKEDVAVVLRQVPTWAYVLGGVGLSYLAYKGYTKKKQGSTT